MKQDLGTLLYEGKAKRVFETNEAQEVIVQFKNDATAFNAVKRAELANKGRVNCQISAHLFELLERDGIRTHYLGLFGEDLMIAKHVKIIPLEVVVRNIAAGSLCKEAPVAFGEILSKPLLDFYYKDDSLKDPLMTDARIMLFEIINVQQRDEIERLSLQVNSVLKSFFEKLDLLLVDFKIEIGINNVTGEIMVADEISPDTCRLWDKRNSDLKDRILDKDRFRQDLGGVVEAYEEILRRIKSICPVPRNYK